jgi:hypothetical protein
VLALEVVKDVGRQVAVRERVREPAFGLVQRTQKYAAATARNSASAFRNRRLAASSSQSDGVDMFA